MEAIIGYTFDDKELLQQAFRHRSATEPSQLSESNQILAWLGDARALLFVRERLTTMFPGRYKDLGMYQALVTSNEVFADIVKTLGLERYLEVDPNVLTNPQPIQLGPDSLGTLYEALIEAITIDQGREAGELFIERTLVPRIPALLRQTWDANPVYQLTRVVSTSYGRGPNIRVRSIPPERKEWEAEVWVGRKLLGGSTGTSWEEARTNAAIVTLALMRKSSEQNL